MASGLSAQVAVAIQSALGTPAAGSNYAYHDAFTYNPGRIKNTGQPRIGGTIENRFPGMVLGNRPGVQGGGPLDLNTVGPILQLAGRTVAAGVYTPVALPALFPYGTFIWLTETGSGFQMQDARLSRLVIDYPPGAEPTMSYTALGTNMGTNASALSAPAVMRQPSPAVTIPAGNLMVFGSTAFVILRARYIIDIALQNGRQPIGSMTPDDVRVIQTQTSAIVTVDATNATIRSVLFGAAAGTALSTTNRTGAFNFRPTVQGGTSHLQHAFADAEWELSESLNITANDDQMAVLIARPIGVVTETLVAA